MEINDKYQQFTEKIISPGTVDYNTSKFRDIHIRVESIYDTLKNSRSSFIYRLIFFYLYSACAISFILHIFIFKFSFGFVFLFLLILYYFYFNYNIKMSLKRNIKSKSPSKIEPEDPEFLKGRIQYVSEGIKVSLDRARMLRNFYMLFFPLLTFILIDIIKGHPNNVTGYFIRISLSFAIGAGVWYYFYNMDIGEINEEIGELEQLNSDISGFK